MSNTRQTHTEYIPRFRAEFTIPNEYQNLTALGSGQYGFVCLAEVPDSEAQVQLGILIENDDIEVEENEEEENEAKKIESNINDSSIPEIDDHWGQNNQNNQNNKTHIHF